MQNEDSINAPRLIQEYESLGNGLPYTRKIGVIGAIRKINKYGHKNADITLLQPYKSTFTLMLTLKLTQLLKAKR